MKRRFRLVILLAVLALLAGLPVSSAAQAPEPNTPPTPPQTPLTPPAGALHDLAAAEADSLQSLETLSLPPLKAVLVVGPIDGDNGAWTRSEVANMELAANLLTRLGVSVHKFYPPNSNWNQIKAAADGAEFFLYRGHGIYWSPMPTPVVGGLALSDGIVSSERIRSELRLDPNAIVMMYACFSAGSSSNDSSAISSSEAVRRVAQYSDPFFDAGASAYFANWFGNAFEQYLTYLFQGQTLGQAYESYFDFNAASVERYNHPDHPGLAMWLDKDDWDGIKYNNAFAGDPNRTLRDLFGPRMTVTPAQITHLVGPGWVTDISIQVGSTGPALTDWTASVPDETPWLALDLANQADGSLDVLVTAPTEPGSYQGTIEITSPQAVNGSETVSINLLVANGDLQQVFLPLVVR